MRPFDFGHRIDKLSERRVRSMPLRDGLVARYLLTNIRGYHLDEPDAPSFRHR
jgi:hypothetical protein